MQLTTIFGWAAILLSVVILVVFAVIRVGDMMQDPPPDGKFEVRYVEHPWVALLHIVPGMIFLLLAPLQFIKRIRKQHIGYHRGMGRVLLVCAMLSGVFALVAAFQLPAFGGISTQAATVFFGAIFLFSAAKAFYHVRKKEISKHREWMIRTFALAMGVATIRVYVGLLEGLAGLGFEAVFGASFWLGLGTNLLVAEVWINASRAKLAPKAG